MFVFNLPEVICFELLRNWCGLRDVGIFDSALCNKEFRSIFAKLISCTEISLESEVDKKYLDDWIVFRGIQLRKVSFQESNFISWNRVVKDNISEVEVTKFTDNSVEQIVSFFHFMKFCKNLTVFHWTCLETLYAEYDAMIEDEIWISFNQLTLQNSNNLQIIHRNSPMANKL